MTFASFKKMILIIETLRIEILKAVKTASAKTVLVLLVFFFPTLNLNAMHIFYTSEKCMLVIAALVEATVQVIPSRQVD